MRISDTDCITDAEEEEEEEEEEKQKHETMKEKEKEKEKQKEQEREQEAHPAARERILSHGGTPQTTSRTPSALDLIKSFNASVRRPDNLERKVCVCTRPLPERWCPGALFCFSALCPLPVRPVHVHRKIENGPCISRLHIAYALPLFHG